MNLQQCEMSPTTPPPPPPNSSLIAFMSLSIFLPLFWFPPCFSLLLSNSSYDLHSFAPTSFSLTTNNIPSSWNSFLCDKSGKRRRAMIRRKHNTDGCACVYAPESDCLFIYARQQRCDCDWAGLQSVAMVACVESLSIMSNVVGVPPSNISESWAALPEKITTISWVTKAWDTKHKRKIYGLPTKVVEIVAGLSLWMCVDRKKERVGQGANSRVGRRGGRWKGLCDQARERLVWGVDLRRGQGKSGRTSSF